MDDRDKIAALKRLLFREAAMRLHNYQKYAEGEARDWEEISEEEQNVRMDLAERFLTIESPEVFADD